MVFKAMLKAVQKAHWHTIKNVLLVIKFSNHALFQSILVTRVRMVSFYMMANVTQNAVIWMMNQNKNTTDKIMKTKYTTNVQKIVLIFFLILIFVRNVQVFIMLMKRRIYAFWFLQKDSLSRINSLNLVYFHHQIRLQTARITSNKWNIKWRKREWITKFRFRQVNHLRQMKKQKQRQNLVQLAQQGYQSLQLYLEKTKRFLTNAISNVWIKLTLFFLEQISQTFIME